MTYPMRRSRKWRMFLLDLFFPNRCPCCHRLIPWQDYLCEPCRISIETPEDAFCSECGKTWEHCICDTELYYDQASVITFYANAAKHGVLSMKKAENLQFGWHCAASFSDRILSDPLLQSSDLIVPVPMAKKRRQTRIVNPAEVIAKELSAYTKIPMRTDLLRDNGSGQIQHTLSAKDRRKNVAQFEILPSNLNGFHIILCDDVLTTGSTVNRCAQLLKSHGAARVTVFAATSSVLQQPLQAESNKSIERKDQ